MLSLSTPLNGKLNVTGSLTSKATGAVGDAIGGLLGDKAAKQIGSINIKTLNASAEIKGNVIITSRPKLAAAWRVEPNLSAQVVLGDTSVVVAGAKVNVPAEIKPRHRQECRRPAQRDRPACPHRSERWSAPRGRNGPRPAARCRCKAAGRPPSLPALWLELKPTRAIAAQPKVDGSAVTVHASASRPTPA